MGDKPDNGTFYNYLLSFIGGDNTVRVNSVISAPLILVILTGLKLTLDFNFLHYNTRLLIFRHSV